MNKLTKRKRIWSLMLTLVMVITMSVTALPSYAANSGTISVKYNPGIAGLDSTDFRLYKVGKYGRDADGKSIIVLEDDFSSCEGVDLNIEERPEEEYRQWQEDWLALTVQPMPAGSARSTALLSSRCWRKCSLPPAPIRSLSPVLPERMPASMPACRWCISIPPAASRRKSFLLF